MAVSEKKGNMDASTEERIKAAARTVFTKKGYQATKVRDIAAEADINLSLVNYYFRSKEKLFQFVMAEVVEKLITAVTLILNNEQLTVQQKVEQVANHYINLLLKNPDFPLFMVNEIFAGTDELLKDNRKDAIFQSHFFKQLAALQKEGKLSIHPIQLMMNLIGFVVMPFLARPLLERNKVVKSGEFTTLMEERRKLIPIWIKGMLK
ncbi:TetR/AcrR family transcriptional regulator [Chitinophaga ginsengisegetis]|uniref:TetR/AcrR family transcriptional regulator n=1 Tax=Chitinophaga ginsengisegetis TaxID=393003 RepID=UPI000DB9FAEC|nr:TetR family transcriptional regulator [Chitinophaga ginsengisegetis]MDR6568025.1 AcrR family transcriptional regulator [Chitinophaga ginsengisegetis]MDR6647420.1 AcrR family transcriptional regulator [Chitinophaga ginsengisegetis]MDR6653770.1 AcrR family transcriptional regulator [Chitinophaga ginsengisegetis]